MDEMPHGIVSCRDLGWVFDLCVDWHIDPQRILKFVPWSREQLQSPTTTIDWESFLTLFSNLGNYFSDEQLFDAGTMSWESRSLRPYTLVGKLLRSTLTQYGSMYGDNGIISRLYPLKTSLREVKRGHLEISLTMQGGLLPCRVFQTLLAGQMAGLPEALGESSANVHVNHTAEGATFDIWYQPVPGPISLFRKLIAWPGAVISTARTLASALDELIYQDAQIQLETTRRRETELRARETELRYRLLEHNVKDVLVTMDANLHFHYVSAAIQGLTGYSKQEVLAMDPGMLLTAASLSKLAALVEQEHAAPTSTGEDTVVEIEMFHRDRSRTWAEIRVSFVVDAQGEPALLIGVISDISERKFFEADLSEREASYQAITTTAQDAIITVDEHNVITFTNPAALRIFGYETSSLEGRLLTELMPEAHVYSGDQGHPRESVPLDGLRGDGNMVSLEASAAEHYLRNKRYVTWIIRDVTFRARIEQERKTLEQQLQAIQRMESIGQLTGGIAHDFNNLLVAINGYAELAQNDGLSNEQLRQYLAEIREAGGRAANMTHKLLAFSRRQIIEPTLVDVNQLIKGVEKMIVRLLPESIEVRFLQGLQNPTILADAGQVEQVLINLVVNARDAMPNGGKLTISVDQRTASSLNFSSDIAAEQEFAVIRVEDTGTGMDDEVQKRIFEPFFTTKPEGEGTGLGMAVAFGIVKQHDGYIDIHSARNHGTRFDVYLPVSEARLPPVKKTRERAAKPSSGTETVLLVEDNPQVRDLARLILVGAGYRVIEAQDGVEALEIFRLEREAISMVIMDVVMPRMGGKEVMTRLRAMNPAIKILFTSGYSSGGIHTNFILEEGLDFIQKPYDANTLRARVRYVLDNRRPGRHASGAA